MHASEPAGGHDGSASGFDDQTLADLGGWSAILGVIADGRDLSETQAAAAMASVLAGNATDAQLAGLIVGLRVKGETVDELVGLTRAMLAAAEPLNLPDGTIDIVGTGGSAHRRRHALNVSTMASFLASAAGATVCKHGNYKASSTSGAFDFLDHLGVRTGLSGPELEACVGEIGLGFALARTFHPAMRHAGPVRAELGIPTVFNVLGPLAHPGQPARQLIGTVSEELGLRMAGVRQRMGSELSWVVTGADGLDELSTSGTNIVHLATPAGVERIEVHPDDVGLATIPSLDALIGGDPAENAAIFARIVEGEPGAARDVVVLNAGAALVVSGAVASLFDAVAAAQAAIDDGRLREKVTRAAEWSAARR